MKLPKPVSLAYLEEIEASAEAIAEEADEAMDVALEEASEALEEAREAAEETWLEALETASETAVAAEEAADWASDGTAAPPEVTASTMEETGLASWATAAPARARIGRRVKVFIFYV